MFPNVHPPPQPEPTPPAHIHFNSDYWNYAMPIKNKPKDNHEPLSHLVNYSELLALLEELKTKFIVGHPTRDKIERAIKLAQ